jgi:hypothetical protein
MKYNGKAIMHCEWKIIQKQEVLFFCRAVPAFNWTDEGIHTKPNS